jgi:hypothetical protein
MARVGYPPGPRAPCTGRQPLIELATRSRPVTALSVEAIATDEERFLDRSRTRAHVIEEHVTSA